MRIAGLDGLRAIAVSGVLLYHGGVSEVPGGFLGVDLFFVISGFLITTLLLEEAVHREGRIDLVAFWGRRARRLLPALLVVTAATVVLFTTYQSIAEATNLRRDALAALLYVANWHFLLGGEGYFEALAAPSPLQHTWSLAIEEQFYVVWPLLLSLILRLRASRRVHVAVVTLLVVTAVGWVLHQSAADVDADRLYYGTDTRAPAILFGVLAAFALQRVVPSRLSRRRGVPSGLTTHTLNVAGPLALFGVVAVMCTTSSADASLFRGRLLLFAAVSTALLGIIVCSPRGPLTRVLDCRPLRTIGVLSYGLYLWHWPVFLFLSAGRTGLTGSALLAERLIVTIGLAAASYRLVELPLRRATWQAPRRLAMPAGAAAVACGLVLVATSNGWRPEPLHTVLAGQRRPPPMTTGSASPAIDLADEPARPSPSPPTAGSAAARHRLRVTILGDSTAATLVDGLRDRPGSGGVDFRDAATTGCGVTTAMPYRYMGEISPYERRRCRTWTRRWERAVLSRPADVVAVLVGRWEVADQVVDGSWTHAGTVSFDGYLRHELEKAVAAASAGGATVVFLTAPYYSRGEQPDGSIWPEDDPARVDAVNRLLRLVAAEHRGLVEVVEFGRRMSGGRHEYVPELGGVDLRYDGVHFTRGAARWIQPWLEAELSRAAR
jgi:peptidoglycan/LPS O-acetylase OafA/YrhL